MYLAVSDALVADSDFHAHTYDLNHGNFNHNIEELFQYYYQDWLDLNYLEINRKSIGQLFENRVNSYVFKVSCLLTK